MILIFRKDTKKANTFVARDLMETPFTSSAMVMFAFHRKSGIMTMTTKKKNFESFKRETTLEKRLYCHQQEVLVGLQTLFLEDVNALFSINAVSFSLIGDLNELKWVSFAFHQNKIMTVIARVFFLLPKYLP